MDYCFVTNTEFEAGKRPENPAWCPCNLCDCTRVPTLFVVTKSWRNWYVASYHQYRKK
jgi:hypothetical protein